MFLNQRYLIFQKNCYSFHSDFFKYSWFEQRLKRRLTQFKSCVRDSINDEKPLDDCMKQLD